MTSQRKNPEDESLDELIALMDAQINATAKGAKKPKTPPAEQPKQGE